jgi:hypothetical protein
MSFWSYSHGSLSYVLCSGFCFSKLARQHPVLVSKPRVSLSVPAGVLGGSDVLLELFAYLPFYILCHWLLFFEAYSAFESFLSIESGTLVLEKIQSEIRRVLRHMRHELGLPQRPERRGSYSLVTVAHGRLLGALHIS